MIKFTDLYSELQNQIVKKCTDCEKFPLMFVNRCLNKLSYKVSGKYRVLNDYLAGGKLNLLKFMYKLNYKTQYDYMAAYHGHLDILKWLYEKNGKLSQDCALYAHYTSQKHVEKWLEENYYEMFP